MSLWRRTRTEVAGAWRSLRYDMGRRDVAPVPPPAPDVTSTGMSTFGGPIGDLTGGYDEDLPRRPRRLVAVSAFAALAVAGGAGSYVAVVHGLGPALAGEQPPAAPVQARRDPLTAAQAPAENKGLGRRSKPAVPASSAAPAATTAAPAARPAPATAPVAVPAPRRATPAGLPATACGCSSPPVPTPTAPSGSPSPTPSAGPTPSEAAASGSPTASASPSASAPSSESLLRRRRASPGY